MRARQRRWMARRAAAFVLVLMAGFWAFVYAAPLPSLDEALDTPGTVVLAADGTVLQRNTAEGVRIPVRLADISPLAIEATIAAEDSRFFDHDGVDPIAAARAALNWTEVRSGASTITQQLARRVYLDGGGGWLPWRKSREAVLALWLESHYSKDEILEAYLNDIGYGRGAYGIEAAARLYFGASARNVDLAQAAFLAGLPQNPEANSPDRDIDAARARQAYVLGRLVAEGRSTPAARADALAEEIHLVPAAAPPLAPHFVQMALDEVASRSPELAGRQGLIIETTLDAGLQAEAERIAELHLSRLVDRDAGNAAVTVLDPRTGALLAFVGHAGDRASEHVNLATAERQPGSALKPLLYAAALERGMTLASPLLDVPTDVSTPQGPYSPLNYDRQFHGPVSMRVALASSYNVPAVRTLSEIGMDAFLEIAQRTGLSTLTDTERYGPSLVLGGGEVRLLELTAAYGVFATGGDRVEPFLVRRVRDQSGAVLYERGPAAPVSVLSNAVAWLISDALRDSGARVPGFGERSPLESSPRAAVKTGTTTGFRDNWTIGFTPTLVVGAWAGNADGTPMKDVSGVDGAAPIWRDVLEAAVGSVPVAWPGPPAGLVKRPVCAPTGLLPGPDCPRALDEWFVQGTEPTTAERYYVRDAGGQLAIDPPPEARAWAAEAGLRLAPAPAAAAAIESLQPPDGSVFVIAPELSQAQVLLRATAAGAESIAFSVDGVPAGGRDGGDATVPWTLTRGQHVVEARATFADGSVRTETTTFEVRGQ